MTVEYYRQRASAGLIIAEASQISPMAQGYLDTPGIYSPEQVAAWRQVTDAVHAAGGKIVILEFSSPVVPGFRQLFNFYFANILPRIGGAVSGSRGAYEYLPDSVSKFPNQKGLVEMMEKTGFSNVKYQNLTGGIAAIHSGVKN